MLRGEFMCRLGKVEVYKGSLGAGVVCPSREGGIRGREGNLFSTLGEEIREGKLFHP